MTTRKGVSRRQIIVGTTGAGAALATGILGFPAIGRAQADVIKIGHLTPRTGFLGPLGEYAVMAADLAVEEINAAGGMMGRKIELLKEDSVNPQTASTKAERMIERDKVACIIGEISSASCLTIAQVAQRNKTLFINTGGNSDALRGKDCKRYMFHVESQNSMYVKTVGRSLLRDGLVKGKKWYSLTADYAFGHDLLKVAKRFMEANGGQFAGDDLVPTDATDFSAYLLKIRERQARPRRDSISPATRSPTSSSNMPSSACPSRSAGFGFDTALAWARGQGQLRRHLAAGVASPDRHARPQGVRRRPSPRNTTSRRRTRPGATTSPRRSWRRPMNELKSTESTEDHRAFREGREVRLLKTREGYFRASDHQLMHEMYAVTRCRPTRSRTSGTSSRSSPPVPGAERRPRSDRATKEENSCTFPTLTNGVLAACTRVPVSATPRAVRRPRLGAQPARSPAAGSK